MLCFPILAVGSQFGTCYVAARPPGLKHWHGSATIAQLQSASSWQLKSPRTNQHVLHIKVIPNHLDHFAEENMYLVSFLGLVIFDTLGYCNWAFFLVLAELVPGLPRRVAVSQGRI